MDRAAIRAGATGGTQGGRPRTGQLGRVLRRAWRLAERALRHPAYALSVLVTVCRHPRLLRACLRGGWRAGLLAECAALSPETAGLFSPYEAGFFGQVYLFDEYEVGRLPLPEAPLVCDVGANVGFFSWRVHSIRPAARVLAFEPASANHARLRRVFAARGIGGEVCPQACGAAGGVATLYLRSSVTHSLDPGWHTDLDRGAGSEVVPVTTLDAECDRRGIDHLHLLKIDTEGAEVQVLQGAAGILPQTDHVVLEYHSAAGRAECLRLLRQAGFRCRDKSFWGLSAAQAEEGLLLCTRAATTAPAARREGVRVGAADLE